MRSLLIIVTAGLVLGACSDDSVEKCGPVNKVEECPCAGGKKGVQTCQADGTFSQCECNGAPVDSGLADATADADSKDAAVDSAKDSTPDASNGPGNCVEGCTEDSECAKACDKTKGACVQCKQAADCSRFSRSASCDTAIGKCVLTCRSDGDCSNGEIGRLCNLGTRRCVKCRRDSDCRAASSGDTGKCDTTTGTCRKCDTRAECESDPTFNAYSKTECK